MDTIGSIRGSYESSRAKKSGFSRSVWTDSDQYGCGDVTLLRACAFTVSTEMRSIRTTRVLNFTRLTREVLRSFSDLQPQSGQLSTSS
jgi:hypothetical protein